MAYHLSQIKVSFDECFVKTNKSDRSIPQIVSCESSESDWLMRRW